MPNKFTIARSTLKPKEESGRAVEGLI